MYLHAQKKEIRDKFLNKREELKKKIPFADFSSSARFPIIGGLMQPRGGTARHDAVAWGYARQGNVTSIRFEGRRVHARVQGTEDKPYKVKIWLDTLDEEDW